MTVPADIHLGEDHRLLTESLNLAAAANPNLVSTFYDRLFAAHPGVRDMFPTDMTEQRDKLLKALVALVTHYDHPDQLTPALNAMGRNHVRYGAQAAHYTARRADADHRARRGDGRALDRGPPGRLETGVHVRRRHDAVRRCGE